MSQNPPALNNMIRPDWDYVRNEVIPLNLASQLFPPQQQEQLQQQMQGLQLQQQQDQQPQQQQPLPQQEQQPPQQQPQAAQQFAQWPFAFEEADEAPVAGEVVLANSSSGEAQYRRELNAEISRLRNQAKRLERSQQLTDGLVREVERVRAESNAVLRNNRESPATRATTASKQAHQIEYLKQRANEAFFASRPQDDAAADKVVDNFLLNIPGTCSVPLDKIRSLVNKARNDYIKQVQGVL